LPEFNLWPIYSGSSGNVIFAAYGQTQILIDAGVSATRIHQALIKRSITLHQINGVLVTHEHSDHVSGLPVLARKFGIPVYANRPVWDRIETKTEVPTSNQREFITGESFYIGEMLITPFLLPHDAAEPVGFSIVAGGINACIMTDLGHMPTSAIKIAENADLVLLESNHDVDMLRNGPYPPHLKKRILSGKGHLSNDGAAEAATTLAQAGVKGILLGHISRDNNSEDKAFTVTAAALKKIGASPKDVFLSLAYRDRHGPYIRIR
jgi:phosphoribosyl 1,2-cyclic phosphodiesterase